MKCPKCKSNTVKNFGLCSNCGYQFTKSKKNKKLILISTIVFIIIITLITYIFAFSDDKNNELLEKGFSEYFNINSEITEIESQYKNKINYQNNSLIQIIGDYAKEKYEKKEIKKYNITDGESVWIKFNSGLEYLYVPESKGCDSSDVSTFQPCLNMYDEDVQKYSIDHVDKMAEKIQDTLNDYKFKNNYDNTAVTLDTIKNIGDHDIVIWHGHGGYNTQTHSTLLTNLKLDEEKFLLDPIYYIQKIGYTQDFLNGRIVCRNSGYVEVTYKFFEKYVKKINSKIIYLGTCSSGKDDILPNTLISKGAKSVFANTGKIHTKYNLDMIKSIFDDLLKATDDNKSNTLSTSLEHAKKTIRYFCCNEHNETEVKIWGDNNIKLLVKVTAAKDAIKGNNTTTQETDKEKNINGTWVSSVEKSDKSSDSKAYSYSISETQMILNESKTFNRISESSDANTLTSLKEIIIGTWKNSARYEEYRFYNDGTWERYHVSYSGKDSKPSFEHLLQKGTYKILNKNQIELNTGGTFDILTYNENTGAFVGNGIILKNKQ